MEVSVFDHQLGTLFIEVDFSKTSRDVLLFFTPEASTVVTGDGIVSARYVS